MKVAMLCKKGMGFRGLFGIIPVSSGNRVLSLCKSEKSVMEVIQEKADADNRKIISISWWKEKNNEHGKPQANNDKEALSREISRSMKTEKSPKIMITVIYEPVEEGGVNQVDYIISFENVR